MAIWRWREKNPNIIAQKIPEADIKGFFKRDIVIEPGEALVHLREGQVADIATEQTVKGLGGGLKNWFNRTFDRESPGELLFVQTSELELDIVLGDDPSLSTEDRQPLKGVTTIRFRFNPENTPKVLPLLENKSVLTRKRLGERVKKELVPVVLQPRIAKIKANDFHGNLNLQRDLETASIMEMRKTLSLWGLDLVKMFTTWDKSAYDKLKEHQAKMALYVERADTDRDAQHTLKLHELDRGWEVYRKNWENKWDIVHGNAINQEKIKDVHWDGRLGREDRQFTQQLDHHRSAEEQRIELDRKKLSMEDEADARELKMAMEAKKQLNEMKMARTQQEIDFKNKQMETQSNSTERIMSQAISSGAADPDTVKEMMRQQTMQKALDRESEKVESVSKAEAERYNMESFKEAEDREREHQKAMTDLSAKMMDASKQDLPNTLVTGASSTPVVTHVESKGGSSTCPHCGGSVETGWVACPKCGKNI